jgi:hypothetical protein
MARLTHCLLCIFFLNTWAGNEVSSSQDPPGRTPAEQGAWVARRVDERDTGRDVRMTLRMRLHDRRDRVRERTLTLLSLRGTGGEGDRTLIRFTAPNDIEGTGFLVWEHPSGDDERFLYLPALDRVRRIAASESQESFVGSDFTYEDIGGRKFGDYAYTLVQAPDALEPWVAPDGARHAVYAVESTRRDASARFPRVVSAVRRDNFVVVRADVYNRRGERQLRYDVVRLERVDGYWTALEMRMADELQRTRTELTAEAVEYDIGLTPDRFTRREFERWRLRAPLPAGR